MNSSPTLLLRRLPVLSVVFFLCFLDVFEPLPAQVLPWPSESPFADSYGYRWQTNSAAGGPEFSWVEIEGIGQLVEGLGDEQVVGPISLGFDFSYYWVERSELWVGANGYASFSSSIPISSTSNGFPLFPSHDATDDVIAPFLADLSLAGAGNPGQVWAYQDTAWPRFILSWEEVPFFANTSAGYAGSNSFQLILDGQDSSITFQYRELQGSWDPAYNLVSYPFTVGIENLAGNMGLMPTGLPISTAVLPVDSTAIRFFPPAEPLLQIADLGLQWADNLSSAGIFLPWSPPLSPQWRPGHLLTAQLENLGQISLPSLSVKRQIRDQADNLLLSRTWSVGGLSPGSERFLIDYQGFVPPDTGTYRYRTILPSTLAYQDLNPNNDSLEVEWVVLDTTQELLTFSFETITPQTPLFLYEGSGAAVEFVPFGYPVSVQSLAFYTFRSQGNPPTQGFRARVYARDSSEFPGTLLYEKEVPLTDIRLPFGWTEVVLPQAVQVNRGSLLVVWEQMDPSIRLLTEQQAPFSRRSYELTQGQWRPSRYRAREELLIRATVDARQAIPSVGLLPVSADFSFRISPNPAQKRLSIELPPGEAYLRLIDLRGKMLLEQVVHGPKMELDLQAFPVGYYLLQAVVEQGSQTLPLLIQP